MKALIEKLKAARYKREWGEYTQGYNAGMHKATRIVEQHFPAPEMVESVAIAISQWRNDTNLGEPLWIGLSDRFKSAYRDQAKAAITAMVGDVTEREQIGHIKPETANSRPSVPVRESPTPSATTPDEALLGLILRTLLNGGRTYSCLGEQAGAILDVIRPYLRRDSWQGGDYWLIRFNDPDRTSESFSGAGAEEAARQRFKEVSASWNATLFRSVDSNWVEVALPPAPGAEGEGV